MPFGKADEYCCKDMSCRLKLPKCWVDLPFTAVRIGRFHTKIQRYYCLINYFDSKKLFNQDDLLFSARDRF